LVVDDDRFLRVVGIVLDGVAGLIERLSKELAL
jgi:hypothetical protein